ncbi:MAG: hypothetical protein ETSY2_49255 [Candidatus Entotheonella gemina]|uniref:Peptide chain release factor domain-containing protein n=1 Tax=Candidatus Entotheonella gemina TaxID=1429439 RepID=W4L9H9_9BACT|nr:MAG: hypothetical protein ETSY2_49255 [Candidatus Entotheonella gemina]
MGSHIDTLASEIATLEPAEQRTLWKKVADLNFQHGLSALSKHYRQRLALEGKLNEDANRVLAELKTLREDIAAHDYRV